MSIYNISLKAGFKDSHYTWKYFSGFVFLSFPCTQFIPNHNKPSLVGEIVQLEESSWFFVVQTNQYRFSEMSFGIVPCRYQNCASLCVHFLIIMRNLSLNPRDDVWDQSISLAGSIMISCDFVC